MSRDASPLLALDTAGDVASAALLRGHAVAALRIAEPGVAHAESVLGLVDAVLADAGIGLSAVEAFAVAIGPGSFTSLRIGLATLKGLAFGSERPVAPVSTLAAVAEGAAAVLGTSAAHPLVPLLDARRGEMYAAVYAAAAADDDGRAPVLAEGVYTAEALAPLLPGNAWLVGSGAPLHAEALRAAAADGAGLRLGPSEALPRADAVGRLGRRALAAGRGLPAAQLVPRYLRRPQAEEQRAARGDGR